VVPLLALDESTSATATTPIAARSEPGMDHRTYAVENRSDRTLHLHNREYKFSAIIPGNPALLLQEARQYMLSKSSFTDLRVAESLAMEHHRLHIIERWPEGANKDAALASIRSALAGLLRSESVVGTSAWACIVCGAEWRRLPVRAAFAVAA
jgi:hypothetical protein